MIFSFLKKHIGATFVELLLYIAIFLVLTPILLSVSINSISTQQQHDVEKQISADSQFVMERIYNLISDAKKINVSDSRLGDDQGKLSIIMQDDSVVVIELNEGNKMIEITEGGVTSSLSSEAAEVENLFFDRITDALNDPDIILGISVRMKISGLEKYDVMQDYVVTANLERGDFDEDGCPDYLDKFPKYSECCGDSDADGICDEMDNCVFAYNPFQEDTDEDGMGDECDSSTFFEGGDDEGGGGGGGFSVFNCSADSQLLALIRQEPPLPSSELKQILLSSSPLPPTVLNELIIRNSILTNGHFRQIFVANTKLPEDVYNNVVAMDFPMLQKLAIYAADAAATYIPWLSLDRRNYVTYDVTLSSDAPEGETWTNKIMFDNADPLLGSSVDKKTDVFMIDVLNPTDTITVTTQTASATDTNTISFAEKYIEDDLGFAIELYNKVDNTYAVGVGMIDNTEPLLSITFDFGTGSTVTSPVTDTYDANRYTCYCEGGCSENCGDGGTGIITSNIYTDKCYTWNFLFPEWCSHWYTFLDDNSANPAYVGGTRSGETYVYWEKSFKTILTTMQLQKLKSITVGGEVAYQSLGQFFCDTLNSSCPMSGSLIEGQDIELYNWQTNQWETIGTTNLDGTKSDQQIFEVKYANIDVLKFVGGTGGIYIKARMHFHWNGIPPEGSVNAPCFMLIDYFTLHLLW